MKLFFYFFLKINLVFFLSFFCKRTLQNTNIEIIERSHYELGYLLNSFQGYLTSFNHNNRLLNSIYTRQIVTKMKQSRKAMSPCRKLSMYNKISYIYQHIRHMCHKGNVIA